LAVDSSGNLFLSEPGNARIRIISNGIINSLAGSNTSIGFGGDGGQASAASLNSPIGIALDVKGNLYIADEFNHRIRKVTPANNGDVTLAYKNGVITTVAGTGSRGFSGDGGQAVAAALAFPTGVAVDASGVLYIADSGNDRIRKVDPAGVITTIAGNGSRGFSGDGGSALQAQLNQPISVAVDADGNVLVADSNNNRIRKLTPPRQTPPAFNK